MKRMLKLSLLAGLILLALIASTFGDLKDINEKMYATTLSADFKDGEVWLYAEFANIEAGQASNAGGGTKESQYTLVKANGTTIAEARLNLNRRLDKEVYLSGIRTLLISERFAQEYLSEYLNRLRADETYRKKVITVVTRDELDGMYEALHAQHTSVGYSIENTMYSLSSLGDCFVRSTSRLLENLADSYTGILIPCVALRDEVIALTGYSVIHGAQATDFIPIEECKGLNLLKADRAVTYYTIPYRQYALTLEVIRADLSTQARYEDNQARFTISLRFDAKIEYGDQKGLYDLSESDRLAIAPLLEAEITKDVRFAIDQAQNVYETDYLQLDDAFRVAYPELFEGMDWQQVFAQASIEPKVEVTLKMNQMIDYGADAQ